MAESDNSVEGNWECGWDSHERAQLLRMANLPLSQKLLWLEEAQQIVDYMQSRRRHLPNAKPDAEPSRREEDHE